MIAFTLIIVVLGMSIPSFKNTISNLFITKLSSIAIIFTFIMSYIKTLYFYSLYFIFYLKTFFYYFYSTILIIFINVLFIFMNYCLIIINNIKYCCLIFVELASYIFINVFFFLINKLNLKLTQIKHFNLIKYYSTLINILGSSEHLDPWAVTGFIDAEGCFNIKITPDEKTKTGWQIQLRFSIELNSRDISLLYKIQQFFGVGTVKTRGTTSIYTVSAIKDLALIVEHFNNFTLVTAKSSDYKLWLEAYNLVVAKNHLTKTGLDQLVAIKGGINKGLSPKLKFAFNHIIPLERPIFVFYGIPNPYWISGFVSGDGSLSVTIRSSKTHSLGERVELSFSIALHIRELAVLEGISKFLLNTPEVKYVYKSESRKTATLLIRDFLIINNIIIPFFDKYSLIGDKVNDNLLFKEVVSLMLHNEHLTEAGLAKITAIAEKMNKYN